MWIIWDTKKFITKTANTVKNVVNNPAVITDAIGTLNEQINNWTIQPIQQPSTITGNFFDSEEPADTQEPIDIYNPFAPENQNKTNSDIFAGWDTADDLNFSYGGLSPAIAKSWIFPKPDPNAKDDRTAKQKRQEDWVDPFYKGTVIGQWLDFLAEAAADRRYNETITMLRNNAALAFDEWEKPGRVYISYDPENKEIVYMGPWKGADPGTFADKRAAFEYYYNGLQENLKGAQTEEEVIKYLKDFEEKGKKLFGAWNTSKIPESFTQADLDELSNATQTREDWTPYTFLKMGTDYVPTSEQFWAYVDNYEKGLAVQQRLSELYWVDSEGNIYNPEARDKLSDLRQTFIEMAENGINDRIRKEISSIDWNLWWDATLWFRNFENDQATRILQRLQIAFAYEDEALKKSPNKRTEWDQEIIDWAPRLRMALEKYAANINDLNNLILNEWTKDWEIINTPDVFKDGRTVNDVLTNWLADILWVDVIRNEKHVSPIDLFDFAAKDLEYKYKNSNTDNIFSKAYYWGQRNLYSVWDWRSEVSQAIWTVPIRVGNLLALQFDWSPQSIAYIDMDASIARLIETDDWAWTKILKKFWWETMEYAPEAVGAIWPDLLVYRYFWNWAWTRTLTNIWRIGKFTWNTRILWIPFGNVSRWIKAQENIDKLKEKSTLIKKWLNAFEKVWELWKEWANIDSKRARIRNIWDRTLTQFALWQIQNWTYWVFDYEPYSDTSLWINYLWSALFDILPEAIDFAWAARNHLAWWHWWFNSWVWDVIDFMESSPENKQIVANALHKAHPEFTEQDLRNYLSTFTEVTDAAELVYNQLSKEWKAAANSWTKELLYNYVKQAHWENSAIWAAVRHIVRNQNTTAADILKYLWRIPWDVKIWPYESIIQLKHWTLAWVQAKDGWWYDPALDVLDGGFNRRVTGWFTDKDIADVSKIKGYEDTLKNKNKWFNKVWDTYYLSDEWLDAFWLSSRSLTLESLWVTVEQAENAREILKERMKDLNNKKIDPDTIEALADSGWYDELVNKVKEILC